MARGDLPDPAPRGLFQRLVLVGPGERKPLLWAGGYFFLLLFSFYLVRPVREAMGIAQGADRLPWLMTGTLLTMLVANPLHALLVSRMSRRRFIPLISHVFASNLLLFYLLFRFLPHHGGHALGYAFYIWISVFNLFVLSVFWGLMTDLFTEEQGKRLFGVISMGGTLGAVCGAACTQMLLEGRFGLRLEASGLLLLSLVSLELAVGCMLKLANHFSLPQEGRGPREPNANLGEGLRLIRGSRQLQLICAYILLFAVTSTFLYLLQGRIVAATFSSSVARTTAFARMDLWGNALTLVVQLFVTSRLLRGVGVAGVLLVLPVLTLVGFGTLTFWPGFALLAGFQVLRRGLHYAVDRPAREVLYIPLGPDERYKSKAFIDTFVYRGGDFLGVWAPSLLALVAVPAGLLAVFASSLWLGVGVWLGRLAIPGRQGPSGR